MYKSVLVTSISRQKLIFPINFTYNIFDTRIQLLKKHHTKKENNNNSDLHEDNPTNKKLREIAEFYAKHKAASGVNSFSAFASNKMETLQRLEDDLHFLIPYFLYILPFLLFILLLFFLY